MSHSGVDEATEDEFDEDDDLQSGGAGAHLEDLLDDDFMDGDEEQEEDFMGDIKLSGEFFSPKRPSVGVAGRTPSTPTKGATVSEPSAKIVSEESLRVFFAHGDLEDGFESITLPLTARSSPSSSSSSSSSSKTTTIEVEPASFVFSKKKEENQSEEVELLEIQRICAEGNFSCWFIGDTVQNDGIIYTGTPIDPLFIALPMLERSKGEGFYYSTFDQIFFSDVRFTSGFKTLFERLPNFKTQQLQMICDFKAFEGEELYRLNEDMTLKWLKIKIDRLMKQLELVDKRVVLQKAFSASFKGISITPTQNDYLMTSFGVLSEYVSPFWLQRLAPTFGLTPQDVDFSPSATSATKSDLVSSPYFKQDEEAARTGFRSNRSSSSSLLDSPTPDPVTKKRKTPGQLKIEKVDKRKMSSITSFFGSGKK